MNTITVIRHKGPAWTFTKTPSGDYECKKRNTYRIMFGDPCDAPGVKPIWIGLVLDDGAIVTAEHAIGAKEVVFLFGRYVFNT